MEYWDIYDSDKKVTGRTMQRNDFRMVPGDYHLSVLGVIARSDGRFLITKRKEDKRWAPGWWEVSGGGVMAGESSYDAVCREVFEETGLDVRQCPHELVLTYHRESPGDNYFVDVYRFFKDFDESDVVLQESEATDFRLATHEEIKALAEEGIFLHYSSIRQVFDI